MLFIFFDNAPAHVPPTSSTIFFTDIIGCFFNFFIVRFIEVYNDRLNILFLEIWCKGFHHFHEYCTDFICSPNAFAIIFKFIKVFDKKR